MQGIHCLQRAAGAVPAQVYLILALCRGLPYTDTCALAPHHPCRELQKKFQASLAEFATQLGAVHRQAQSDKTDTREELESLLNLIARLDFNGYISSRCGAR